MGVAKRRVRRSAHIEPWELELVRKVVRAFRTYEKEELEAELARKLLVLKKGRLKRIRDWKRYTTKFLYNKASNWVRDSRARESRHIPIVSPSDVAVVGGFVSEDLLPAREQSDDLRMSFADVWAELSPELRQLWIDLIAEDGNQVAVARNLGKHRNTVRLWIRRIRRVLRRHGIRDSNF